jgi:hypothetical protein
MNFNDCKTTNVNFQSLGGRNNHYTVLKDNENVEKNACNLNFIDIKQDLNDENKGAYNYLLSNDVSTKFYIVSLSVIGVYIFSRILIKSKS